MASENKSIKTLKERVTEVRESKHKTPAKREGGSDDVALENKNRKVRETDDRR